MSVRKGYKQSVFATLSALAILCAFASCASSGTDAAQSTDAPATDSALLDNSASPGATDVSDANAFADLAPKADADKAADDSSVAAAPAADGDTFYNPVGGETLRRVAFTLYSDRSFAKRLLERNPDLKGVKKLSAEQKVFFDMDAARPEPRYLTKDLLDRYSQPLAEKLESAEKDLKKSTVTVNKGESLQDLSQRLYGTHRYWTEIYLVNRDKIKNYDKVSAGLTLTVVDRPSTGMAKAETSAVGSPAKAEMPPPPPPEEKPAPAVTPVAAVTPTQAEPVDSQPAEPVANGAPKDPIPEIPPAASAPPPVVQPVPEPIKQPEAVKPMPVPEQPKPVAQLDRPDAPPSANSNLRRILYVVLILVIGGAAFYFTRTPKRPKVDMLDLNADAGARPKLTPKDSQKSNIG